MRVPRAKLAPTLAMLVAIFVGAMDISITATVMPTIVGQLGGLHFYSWSFSAYLLTSTTTVPLYGRLADFYGRKPLFLIGTGIFVLGSLLCGFATSMEQLVVFRALQGIGAGGLLPITITIAGDLYTGDDRARIQGYISGVWGLAAIVGPLVGSLILAQASWPWVFWINLPIGAAVSVVMWRTLHEEVRRREVQIDYLGALLLTGGIGALLLAVFEGGNNGFLALPILLLLLAAVVMLAVFWAVERRVAEPILPLPLFGQPVMRVASLVALALGGCVYSATTYLPLFVQGVLGGGPRDVAIVTAAVSLGWTSGSIIGGRFLLVANVRSAAVAGLGLVSAGGIGLVPLGASTPVELIMVVSVVLGLGMGITSTTVTIVVQAAVAWAYRGVATAAQQFCRAIGGTLWVSVQGAVLSAAVTGALASGGLAIPTTSGRVRDINEILEPSLRATLAPELLQVLSAVLGDGLRLVFGLFAALALAGLACAWFLPARPLSALQANDVVEGAGRK